MNINKTTVFSVMAGIAAFGAVVYGVRVFAPKVPVVGAAAQRAVDIATAG